MSNYSLLNQLSMDLLIYSRGVQLVTKIMNMQTDFLVDAANQPLFLLIVLDLMSCMLKHNN